MLTASHAHIGSAHSHTHRRATHGNSSKFFVSSVNRRSLIRAFYAIFMDRIAFSVSARSAGNLNDFRFEIRFIFDRQAKLADLCVCVRMVWMEKKIYVKTAWWLLSDVESIDEPNESSRRECEWIKTRTVCAANGLAFRVKNGNGEYKKSVRSIETATACTLLLHWMKFSYTRRFATPLKCGKVGETRRQVVAG